MNKTSEVAKAPVQPAKGTPIAKAELTVTKAENMPTISLFTDEEQQTIKAKMFDSPTTVKEWGFDSTNVRIEAHDNNIREKEYEALKALFYDTNIIVALNLKDCRKVDGVYWQDFDNRVVSKCRPVYDKDSDVNQFYPYNDIGLSLLYCMAARHAKHHLLESRKAGKSEVKNVTSYCVRQVLFVKRCNLSFDVNFVEFTCDVHSLYSVGLLSESHRCELRDITMRSAQCMVSVGHVIQYIRNVLYPTKLPEGVTKDYSTLYHGIGYGCDITQSRPNTHRLLNFFNTEDGVMDFTHVKVDMVNEGSTLVESYECVHNIQESKAKRRNVNINTRGIFVDEKNHKFFGPPKRVLFLQRHKHVKYIASLKSDIEVLRKCLHVDFESALKELPDKFDTTDYEKVWKPFVERYGTHRVVRIELGGKRCRYFWVDDNARDEAELILNNKKEGYLYSHRAACTGGDVAVQFKGIDEWSKTIAIKNAGIVDCQLAPIQDLVADENKRFALKQAIDLYVQNSAYALYDGADYSVHIPPVELVEGYARDQDHLDPRVYKLCKVRVWNDTHKVTGIQSSYQAGDKVIEGKICGHTTKSDHVWKFSEPVTKVQVGHDTKKVTCFKLETKHHRYSVPCGSHDVHSQTVNTPHGMYLTHISAAIHRPSGSNTTYLCSLTFNYC